MEGGSVGFSQQFDSNLPGKCAHFFNASFSMNSLRSRSRTKYMFAYWCLKDLKFLLENEGVRFVRGRTLVGSRVIGAAGTALANSQTARRLRDIRQTVVPLQRKTATVCGKRGRSRVRTLHYCIGELDGSLTGSLSSAPLRICVYLVVANPNRDHCI